MRSLQWSHGLYQDQLNYCPFNTLSVPVDLWFTFMSTHHYQQFALQDPPHVAKKLRNQLGHLNCHVLNLGDIESQDKEQIVVRWDYVLELADRNEAFLFQCGKSAVNMIDKQDPSLVTDISCLYQYFLDAGMYGMGLYFKSIHLFLTAFYHPSLTPSARMKNAWYAKSFFTLWERNRTDAAAFISQDSFKDLKCCCDGLLMYLLLMKRRFSDCPVVPGILGSDIVEQAFAFARIGVYAGRRTNLEALRLAFSLERMNR